MILHGKKLQEWPVGPNPIPASYSSRAAYLFLKAPCYGTGNAIAPLSWDSDRDCDGSIDSIDLCPDDSNKKQAGICGCTRLETKSTEFYVRAVRYSKCRIFCRYTRKLGA